ncbi:prepilin peptidase [Desulfoscipio geothermicus]|uniref:Flp pilus assembly protein, protease CpaA n=1 Tax=Desulfoscipio geothermicus DSM 3669 TaxID=1121426 RepID=A0A1I6E4E6_9FIRM|nr:prepilin peptidase [Desulfoscipio geothermicus]SFR12593.1 Flp pilus assembly protein, protease CpaA [Desulfoscipio geothermicus DSM 3669]
MEYYLDYGFYLAVAVLIALGCYYDVRTKIMPLWCTVTIFTLGVIYNTIKGGVVGLGAALMGGIFFLLIYLLLIYRFSVKMGGGDLKLIIAVGTFAGINNMAVLIPLYFFCSSIMELVHFAILKKAYNPITYAREFWTRYKLEKYKMAEPVEKIYGPFIGVPFIIYLIINITGVV